MTDKKEQNIELSEKEIKELTDTLAKERKALQDFRFGVAGGKVKNIKDARKIRRRVATILTKLNTVK